MPAGGCFLGVSCQEGYFLAACLLTGSLSNRMLSWHTQQVIANGQWLHHLQGSMAPTRGLQQASCRLCVSLKLLDVLKPASQSLSYMSLCW